MLGETGDAWLTRLHMQLARELRGQGWSQMNIAAILGTTQSTISRQYQKPVQELPGSADELIVDGWAKEIAGVYFLLARTKNSFVSDLLWNSSLLEIKSFDLTKR